MTSKNKLRTEDEVRDAAKLALCFDHEENGVQQGTGQLKTFNQLGFQGIADKPDGWYLPDNKNEVAIILEVKGEHVDIQEGRWHDELKKNMKITASKYKRVVGIINNGIDTIVMKLTKKDSKQGDEMYEYEQMEDASSALQPKSYYLSLFSENKLNKHRIYTLTKKINDCLHFQFGIKNLYHRMIFTACALVAKRYGAILNKGIVYKAMTTTIIDTLEKSLEDDQKQNIKLKYLIEVYGEISMNRTDNQEAIDNFISWVTEISEHVGSDYWNGEDVMGIFFNEFNRYKKKSESGQVFTPDHITSFMYRILDIRMYDRVLDATCGSGAFLVKSMCNMIKEAGGANSTEATDIKSAHLFGIENDREIFALACANMLIHKDGKTNLEQLDTRTDKACDWIKSKNISKVLMNPPYERKYGCMKIVQNVLNSVPIETDCAFILPDKKLEKDGGTKLLRKHQLTTIIKLPSKLFFGVSVPTSIFIFKAGIPQKDSEIIGYHIEDDGLETVKNQGRQDIMNRWQEIEDYWVKSIHNGTDERFGTRQIIDPSEHLSYQMPTAPFEIYEEDFTKTVMDYLLYKQQVNVESFSNRILNTILYSSTVLAEDDNINVKIKTNEKD